MGRGVLGGGAGLPPTAETAWRYGHCHDGRRLANVAATGGQLPPAASGRCHQYQLTMAVIG